MARTNYTPPTGFVVDAKPLRVDVTDERYPGESEEEYQRRIVGTQADETTDVITPDPNQPVALADAETNVDIPEGYMLDLPDAPEMAEEPKPEVNDPAGIQGLLRGYSREMLLHGDDELAGLVAATRDKIGAALGIGVDSEIPFAELVEMYRDRYSDETKAIEEESPIANTFGTAAGIGASMLLPAGKALDGATAASRVGRSAAIGGAYGTTAGALDADPGSRIEGGGAGLAFGTTAGVVLPKIIGVGGTALKRVYEATGAKSFIDRKQPYAALDALFLRAPQDAQKLLAEAARREAAGLPPNLLEVLDEAGAGIVAASGIRPVGREAAEGYASRARADLPDTVASRAAPISPESRPVAEVVDEIKAGRKTLADEQYSKIRNVPVPLTRDVTRVLNSGAGRRALNAVAESSDSPEEVAAIGSVLKVLDSIPPNIGAQAREQIIKQVTGGNGMTLDTLDRVKRALQARIKGGDASGQERQLQKMVDDLITIGDSAAPGYAAARGNFQAQSGLAEAAELGSDMLKGNADEFIAGAVKLGGDAVKVSQVADDGGVTLIDGPSERDVARTAARRTIELAAQESPRAAMAVSDKMAYGRNAFNRLTALTGPKVAEEVREGMELVGKNYGRAQLINPNAGSKTARTSMDSNAMDGAIDLGLSAISGGKVGVVRAVLRMLDNTGIKNADAAKIVDLATDPRQLDGAIEYLTRRGLSRAKAERVIRQIAAVPAARAAGVSSGEEEGD